MQVEIQEQETRVKASDIKVGDVITWGEGVEFYMNIDSHPDEFIRLDPELPPPKQVTLLRAMERDSGGFDVVNEATGLP